MKRKTHLIFLILLMASLLFACTRAATDEIVFEETIKELESQVDEQNLTIDALEGMNASLKDENLTSPSLIGSAVDVVTALSAQDMAVFSSYVHPSLGVRFTAYSYVITTSDLSFASLPFASLISDPTLYTWGTFDGSGEPIIYSFSDYFDNFIYDEDYLNPHLIGVNNFIGTGNTTNNIATVYPTASFVEFHFTGFDPQYGGIDWTSLILVFENVAGEWKLVGVVHNQWTI